MTKEELEQLVDDRELQIARHRKTIARLRREKNDCGKSGRSAVSDLKEKSDYWKQKYLDLKETHAEEIRTNSITGCWLYETLRPDRSWDIHAEKPFWTEEACKLRRRLRKLRSKDR